LRKGEQLMRFSHFHCHLLWCVINNGHRDSGWGQDG